MGRTNGPKLPSFCLNRIRPLVRVRSPTVSSKADQGAAVKVGKAGEASGDGAKAVAVGRKVMVVVESSLEARDALQWALSHTIQSQDKLVLLHVTKPHSGSTQGKPEEYLSKERAPRAFELVNSLRNVCLSKRPEVETEVIVMQLQGKEKGPTIVEEAKRQGIGMLVLGQKKRSNATWRLLMMWAGHRITGLAEYCIQNAECMTVAVRRKNRRIGGYLITTKRHKDFWLLA